MIWIDVKDRLPEVGKYVLARHSRGTWFDSSDQENVNCVVVKLVRGISIEERNNMKAGIIPDIERCGWCESNGITTHKRSVIYRSEDEHGNNKVPYNWEQFGSDSFFGQDITHWIEIPKL